MDIDQKPEKGCEIQNSADEGTGIILRLKLVKKSSEGKMHNNKGLPHGCIVLKEQISPWFGSNCIVC
mgnify:CR=1 FL=1